MSKEIPLTLPTMNGTTAAPVAPVSPSQFHSQIAKGDLSGGAVEEGSGNAYDVLGVQRPSRLDQPPPPTAISNQHPPTATRARPAAKSSKMAWYIAQGEAGAIRMLGPFDNQAVALDTQEALGGKSRLYEAESKNKAEAAHIAFLTRISRGHDSW